MFQIDCLFLAEDPDRSRTRGISREPSKNKVNYPWTNSHCVHSTYTGAAYVDFISRLACFAPVSGSFATALLRAVTMLATYSTRATVCFKVQALDWRAPVFSWRQSGVKSCKYIPTLRSPANEDIEMSSISRDSPGMNDGVSCMSTMYIVGVRFTLRLESTYLNRYNHD